MISEPVLLPSTVGVKVMLMVQLAPTARLDPQVLSCAKSPLNVILVIISGAVPVLLMVTACGALVAPTGWPEKVRLTADKLTTGAGKPLPARLIVCGLPTALSAMVTEPYRLPGAVGVKVTVIAHAAPAATLAPQVLVWAKSPLAVMPVMVKAATPVFVKVAVRGALVLPTASPLKVKLMGDKATTGARTPVPFSGRV
jgi:hypothetical protein